MKKKIFTVIAFVISLVAVVTSHSADKRSLYHVGASAGIATAAEAIMLTSPTAYEDRYIRRAAVFGGCMAVGAAKEFVYDAEESYEDLAFNALGCAIPIFIGETYFLKVDTGAVTLVGSW